MYTQKAAEEDCALPHLSSRLHASWLVNICFMCCVDVTHIIGKREMILCTNPPPHRPYLSWSPKRSRASYRRMKTHLRREPTSCGLTLKRGTTVSQTTHMQQWAKRAICLQCAQQLILLLSQCTNVRERGSQCKHLLPFLNSCSYILQRRLHFTISCLA